MTRHTISRRTLLASTAIAATWLGLCPQIVFADPQSELAAASEHLDSLGAQLSDLQNQLATATDDLESTESAVSSKQADIETTKTELDAKRQVLSDRMRSSYKSGSTSFMDFVLGATSAEDLVSRIYYMDKINESDADAIDTVVTLEAQLEQEKSELEAKQADQQAQVDSMQSQVDEYQSAVAEAQTYYSQLDAEVQAELAAQAAAAATSNVGTVVNAITTTQKAQELVSGSTGGSGSSSSGGSSSGGSGSGSGSSSGGSSSGGSGSGSGSSSGSGSGSSSGTAYPCGGVSSAYSCLGYPYVYGACSPSVGFDCGGLVFYCFVGRRLGNARTIGEAIHDAGLWKNNIDDLVAGDVVFLLPEYNHVGIYVGGGQVIHAANPTRGVVLDSYSYLASYFQGGGPYSGPYS